MWFNNHNGFGKSVGILKGITLENIKLYINKLMIIEWK